MTSSSGWISSNLSLVGFNVSQTAFMTFKELIENSIDATSSSQSPKLSVRIDQCGDLLEISCCDNGLGFLPDSIESIQTIFNSLRSSNASTCTGKFGIGLKAIVMMCHSSCGGRDVSVKSLRAGSNSSVSFDLGCSESHDVIIKNVSVREVAEANGFTTCVTACSPFPPDLNLFCQDIRSYITELVTLRGTLHVALSVDDEDEEQFVGDFSHTKVVNHSDPSGFISCSVGLVTTQSEGKCINIVRYVNSTPLMTTNSSNCSLLAGCVSAISKQAASLGIEFMPPILFLPDSIVTSACKVSSPPQGSSWTSVVVRVNLTHPSKDVDYTCLSKDGVSGVKSVSSNLSGIVVRCVRGALKKAQTRFSMQFQSNEVFEHKRALSVYIPSIAHNLAELVARVAANSDNETTRFRLREIIGDTTTENVEAKLKSVMTETLVQSKQSTVRSG